LFVPQSKESESRWAGGAHLSLSKGLLSAFVLLILEFPFHFNTNIDPFNDQCPPAPQTSAGDVLVSVNPYKKLALYTLDVVDAYKNKSLLSHLPPHM
jgi:hypothetical protein